MTDPQTKPSATKVAAVRSSSAATTSQRRSHPAAASRILVTGLSVAATLGLASTMAAPDAPDIEPSATQVADRGLEVPAAVTASATDQPVVTTSHAS